MSNTLKKNLGLQTLYQILNTIVPLATSPYLSRTLGAEKIGIFSYTSSVVSYFVLFGMLGTMNYGTRKIASLKDDKKERGKIFLEIYILQLFISLLFVFLYLIYLKFFCKDNLNVATVQLLAIMTCLLDISWLFFGMENFQIIVSRNIIIKLVVTFMIFFYIKTSSDLRAYTLIMVGSNFFNQLILWTFLKRLIIFQKVKLKDILSHIKPNIILFIPLLAMSIYHAMDKTMLGLLSTYEQVGFYYNADKIINIPLCIINGVGTVMLPRMTMLFKEKSREEAENFFLLSLEIIIIASTAMCFGISAIAKEFVPVFFGKGYDECIILIMLLSPVLIIKAVSNTVRTQYLIPLKMEKFYIKSVILGAIVNIIFNALFISKLGALGAVLGTLLAELIACIWQFIEIKKYIQIKKYYFKYFNYLLSGMIMVLLVRIFANVNINIYIKLILEIIIGMASYLFCIILYLKISNNPIKNLIKYN